MSIENSWRLLRRIWLILRMHVVIVLVAAVAMVLKKGETTKVPLRLWLVGYGVLRVIQSVCVCVEYGRSDNRLTIDIDSFTKPLVSIKSVLILFWWITGFYWMYFGGKTLANDAPNLYWLTAIVLAFDLFVSVIIPVAIACTLVAASVYCLAFISSILRLLSIQYGSSQKLIAEMIQNIVMFLNYDARESVRRSMNEAANDTPTLHALSTENAVCGICRKGYEDGRLAYELPCGHLVHRLCVSDWLQETLF
ncbi:E3 ubiquitin-protein ligase At1g63170-like [Silene latifolia]|uniref:E3 ubiquitin-protein ligase At1g63170-like n=1 Tax=Silene latifolia TaxID=37657 RepID=UPI003D782E76